VRRHDDHVAQHIHVDEVERRQGVAPPADPVGGRGLADDAQLQRDGRAAAGCSTARRGGGRTRRLVGAGAARMLRRIEGAALTRRRSPRPLASRELGANRELELVLVGSPYARCGLQGGRPCAAPGSTPPRGVLHHKRGYGYGMHGRGVDHTRQRWRTRWGRRPTSEVAGAEGFITLNVSFGP
jgi:hypothetical protein